MRRAGERESNETLLLEGGRFKGPFVLRMAAELLRPVQANTGLAGAPVRSAWTGEGDRPHTSETIISFALPGSGLDLLASTQLHRIR
jgi:hypothetical protein